MSGEQQPQHDFKYAGHPRSRGERRIMRDRHQWHCPKCGYTTFTNSKRPPRPGPCTERLVRKRR